MNARRFPDFFWQDKFVPGDRVEGFAGKPTGMCGTVRSVLKQSRTRYRVDWDSGSSSTCSPLALVRAEVKS